MLRYSWTKFYLDIDLFLELKHNDNVSVLIFLRLDSAQNVFYTQVKKDIKMVINNFKVCVIRHEADYNVKNEGLSLFKIRLVRTN